MKKLTIGLAALTLVLAMSIPATGNHGEQTGENSDCLDYNVLYQVSGTFSPGAVIIDAHDGAYTTGSSDGNIYVDFYDADGNWLGWNGGASSGDAPDDTTQATICVGATGGYPDAPLPLATWTFTQ